MLNLKLNLQSITLPTKPLLPHQVIVPRPSIQFQTTDNAPPSFTRIYSSHHTRPIYDAIGLGRKSQCTRIAKWYGLRETRVFGFSCFEGLHGYHDIWRGKNLYCHTQMLYEHNSIHLIIQHLQQNTIDEGVEQLNKAWDEYGINFLVRYYLYSLSLILVFYMIICSQISFPQ